MHEMRRYSSGNTGRRRPCHTPRHENVGYCKPVTLYPFLLTIHGGHLAYNGLRGLRETLSKRVLGYAEYYQIWPDPALVTADTDCSKKIMKALRRCLSSKNRAHQKNQCGFFRLPLEIRMHIYDLVFPFEEIHLSKIYYQGKVSCFHLNAYPCLAEPDRKPWAMCHCLYGEVRRMRPATRGCVRGGDRQEPLSHIFFYPLPSPKNGSQGTLDQLSEPGLWELWGVMYASKAL